MPEIRVPSSSTDHDGKKHTGLRIEQKAGLALLLVFALLTVSLGVLQMRNTIYNPFALELPENDKDLSGLVSDETARLQNIDTDQDGLTDYEELYFYQTSPYLPDTDSDGKTDAEEIQANKDPLCPEGQDCSELTPDSSGQQDNTLVGEHTNFDRIDAADVLNNLNTQTVATTSVDFSNLQQLGQDPDLVRQLLLESGQISEEELAQIDDETLLQMTEQILGGQ